MSSNSKTQKDQPSGQKEGISCSNFSEVEKLKDGRSTKLKKNQLIWIDVCGVIRNHRHQSVFDFEGTPPKKTELSKFLKALEEFFYLKWVEIMSTKKLPITPLLEYLKKKCYHVREAI